ncbi:hypothetical protein RJT34_13465 [Clitoria ternatea]|uniref:Uncharacterized protein n=1 Tax=Clitoria ternatea TaxID=43366 RepID=A0AAN9JP16_CLITE
MSVFPSLSLSLFTFLPTVSVSISVSLVLKPLTLHLYLYLYLEAAKERTASYPLHPPLSSCPEVPSLCFSHCSSSLEYLLLCVVETITWGLVQKRQKIYILQLHIHFSTHFNYPSSYPPKLSFLVILVAQFLLVHVIAIQHAVVLATQEVHP